ncbi:MAG: hypothetical protein AABZ79_14775, partial [Pseudomonadota bacterium]
MIARITDHAIRLMNGLKISKQDIASNKIRPKRIYTSISVREIVGIERRVCSIGGLLVNLWRAPLPRHLSHEPALAPAPPAKGKQDSADEH